MSNQNSNEAQGRKKALKGALKQINKEFGKGAIMRMGDSPHQNIDVIPSGSLLLDNALGIGGYPRGRVTEIFGAESAGKTTLALEATAECQKRGGTVAYIDAENALDPVYAKHLGVNIDDLYLSQPGSGEEGLQIAEDLVSSGAVDLVVVDSVAALVPKEEISGEMGDSHVGLQARLMSQALRKMSGSIYDTNTAVIFINQLREKVGVMFGSPETTPGGRALKFYASVRLRISRGQKIKNGKDVIGSHAKIKVVKNKVAPPFKQCQIDIMYGSGISQAGEIIDMAVDKDIIDKGGAWFTIAGHRLQGRENAKKFLNENPEIRDQIKNKVMIAYHIPGAKKPKAKDSKSKAKNTQTNSKDKK